MVRGANTAITDVVARRVHTTSPPAGAAAMSWRAAVTRWVTGFRRMTVWSQPGVVAGSTKTLLAMVRGNRTTTPMFSTVAGVRTTRPSAVHIHDTAEQKARVSARAALTPATPPAGR